MKMHMTRRNVNRFGQYQSGVATLAVGILLLVLITLVTLYGARVGLMEQRISANDYRAKLVQSAADAGTHYALEYLNANLSVFSMKGESYIDADGNMVEGWFGDSGSGTGTDRWGDSVTVPSDCDPQATDADGDPTIQAMLCSSGLIGDVYVYGPGDNQGLNDPVNRPPDELDALEVAEGHYDDDNEPTLLNVDREAGENRVGYEAGFALCALDAKAGTNPGDPFELNDPRCIAMEDRGDEDRFFATLVVSRGFLLDENGAEIEDGPQAFTKEVAVKFDMFGSGPKVPLTVAGTYDGGGTFDIVTNPNGGPSTDGGGRSGAPFTVWSGGDYNMAGTTVTCQRDEFFATDSGGNDTFGDTPPMDQYEVCYSCSCPQKDQEFWYLSSTRKDESEWIDIYQNHEDFPDDLFRFTFGVPREQKEIIKDLATVIPSDEYPDCDALSTADSGLFWSEGDCSFQEDIGNPHEPLVMISEGKVSLESGAKFFGVIYAYESELDMRGGAQIYGAILADSQVFEGGGKGSNTIIFDSNVLHQVSLSPKFQRVSVLPGTWADQVSGR